MVSDTEGNTCIYRYGEILCGTTGSKVSHAVQWHYINWGEPVCFLSCAENRVCPTTKRRKANGIRVVGWPDSTDEAGQCRQGEAGRGCILTALPCRIILKRKHRLYTGIGESMETKLERISQLSKENLEMVFMSIGHLINKEMLKECRHEKMDGEKATGIDGVTKDNYGKELDKNIDVLVNKLKEKSYRPQPAKRVEIEKENGKTRPLNIYCYEDKLVQESVRRILEVVFEPHFYDGMMGFRPGGGCHMAIQYLNATIRIEQIIGKMWSGGVESVVFNYYRAIDHEKL